MHEITTPSHLQKAQESLNGQRGGSKNDRVVHDAGKALFNLAARETDSYSVRHLFEYEVDILERSLAHGQVNGSDFYPYLMGALKLALANRGYDMARRLLNDKMLQNAVRNESDILHVAINTRGYDYVPENTPGALRDTVELLVSHGAPLSTLDDAGNSPLYYTCRRGRFATFRYLIKMGAFPFTFHKRVEKEITMGPVIQRFERPANEVNLLQVALDSCINCSRWNHSQRDRWGPIIMDLIDMGMRVPVCDPALAKFLHMACYRGEVDYVKALLNFGAQIDAHIEPRKSEDIYDSALHAAIAGHQVSLVDLLIKQGADIHAQRTCRWGIGDESKLTPSMLLCKSPYHPGTRSWFPQICNLLVDAGLNVQEKHALLSACALRGHHELLGRLLEEGCRLNEVPVPIIRYNNGRPCYQVVKQLIEGGASIDSPRFQAIAAMKGNLALLKYLVQRDGPLITPGDLGLCLCDAVRSDLPMLEYFVTEYQYDINAPFEAEKRTSLPWEALEKCQSEAVRLLLSLGAQTRCPGLPETALDHLRSLIESQNGLRAELYIPVTNMLLHYDAGGSLSGNTALVSMKNETEARLTVYSQRLLNRRQTLTASANSAGHSPNFRKAVSTDNCPFHPCEDNLISFTYGRLAGARPIRLMQLQPSCSPASPIECNIIQHELTNDVEYEALSYVWGDGARKTSIRVAGHRLDITVSLASALYRLRRQDKPRMLWIDAICINQNDVEERNQQVSIMRDIYRHASTVNIWLGEHADNSELVFQHPHKYDTKVMDGEMYTLPHADDGWYLHKNPNTLDLIARVEAASQALCQRPWFLRTWIIQEICHSWNATVMCGPDTQCWRVLRSTLASVAPLERSHHSLHGIDSAAHLLNLEFLQNHCQTYGYSLLSTILGYSRLCYATDPRDRVYGIMGLFDKQLIDIDYSADACEVYRRFTQAIIESTRGIDILHWFGTSRKLEGLCTWVPNYSVSNPVGTLPGYFGMQEPNTTHLSKVLPGIQFHGDRMLIWGKEVETIKGVGEELAVTPTSLPGSERFSQIMSQWEELAVQLNCQRFGRSISEVFCETLIAGHGCPKMPTRDSTLKYRRKFISWYYVYGTGPVKEHDPIYFQDYEVFRAWSGLKYEESDMEQDLDEYAYLMENVCFGRRLCLTEKGSIGLVSPRAQPGDRIVFFPGTIYPFLLREVGDGMFHMVGDCFLCGFDQHVLFEDNEVEVREFTLQ